MKNFKLMGLNFECEDQFNFAAMDEDLTFLVYIEDPTISQGVCWDSTAEMFQVHPLTYDGRSTHWKDSKIEI